MIDDRPPVQVTDCSSRLAGELMPQRLIPATDDAAMRTRRVTAPRHSRPSRAPFVAAVGAMAVVALTACSGSDGVEFGGTGGESTACGPAAVGQAMAFGTTLRAGDEALVIRDVQLVDAEGLELTDAQVIPLTMSDGVGVLDYPPVEAAAWQDREDAVGTHLDPEEAVELVLGVTRTSEGPASSSAIRLHYVMGDDGDDASTTNEMNIELADNCS